ncbi:MAG: NADH:flavin oxidoreductase/NADH oxidase [Deltaproteobacteria bacterium]|nr:NADH:flavin oxidoreductase/NADH oxidase [Deltaproteobacteria bacterium]
MARLFSGLTLKGASFKNRIFVSPMCQYSSEEGMPTDWHLVHLGSRAVGGAAMVMIEATAVSPEGRISPWDSGIWTNRQAQAFLRITSFIKAQGALPGIQLAHAGRKASTDKPWRGEKFLGGDEGGWQPLAPSPLPFNPNWPDPREMSPEEIRKTIADFATAAERALDAGFEVLELHMAHGYLAHEFLSPLSNKRKDEYGGNPENRMRFPLQIANTVREIWPKPLFVRISCTDWVDGGWNLAQSLDLCRHLKKIGVDLIDCSSGGIVPDAKIPAAPGYQTPFAAAIRKEIEIATGAVGLILEPAQAEQILVTGQADAIFLAREMLRNPYWPLQAAKALRVELPWSPQYERARPR